MVSLPQKTLFFIFQTEAGDYNIHGSPKMEERFWYKVAASQLDGCCCRLDVILLVQLCDFIFHVNMVL